MASNIEEFESSTPEQEARTKLRDSFLRALHELSGQQCSILTYEKSTLNATLTSWDPDGHEILVKDLQTPAHMKMETALLRTPDILALQFDKSV
ncbi:uncharacterized protein LOC115443620 [Manduca sexta]|uniref:uncharacterized protein LOC115443620 n=1 Tax=Manduca sexta TaxID=7130 RepID=UPI0011823968|nr:uncharacterized protein LOC115443620 [Manduca sexta]